MQDRCVSQRWARQSTESRWIRAVARAWACCIVGQAQSSRCRGRGRGKRRQEGSTWRWSKTVRESGRPQGFRRSTGLLQKQRAGTAQADHSMQLRERGLIKVRNGMVTGWRFLCGSRRNGTMPPKALRPHSMIRKFLSRIWMTLCVRSEVGPSTVEVTSSPCLLKQIPRHRLLQQAW